VNAPEPIVIDDVSVTVCPAPVKAVEAVMAMTAAAVMSFLRMFMVVYS
jgi:hypothetical protein